MDPDREMSEAVRARLAAIAVDLFIELAGRESPRILRSWQLLRDSLDEPELVAVAPLLAQHEAGALELAQGLDKEVAIRFELEDVHATPTIAEVLDVATLHQLRAAIEHGIESPDARDFAAQPREAEVVVRLRREQERLVLEIRDDSLDAAGQRPGVDDAVASRVTAVGGHVALRSRPGEGTTCTVSIPVEAPLVRVRTFTATGTTAVFAVTADWIVTAAPTHAEGVIDLAEELGLGTFAANPHTLMFERGDKRVFIAAATEPVDADARWLVATSEDDLAGVVSIAGTEALLVRPDVLAACTGCVAIADDNEIARELVGFALKPLGIEVFAFADAAPMFAAFAATPADLVLVDPAFKKLDPAATIERIRSALPGCVVYLYSDRAPSELVRITAATGADGYLSKTLGREQFVTRVLRILRGRRR